ncbi:MAG: glycosyltransferase family 4 protein [Candidatus Nezhaarchaeota archaeon]|nr:glycosyltransferase family 4 protein [Candidatus Nezhaarchaeota archaeon]
MKVLYISQSYHPQIGGIEYVVKSVAERLVRRGHDVAVLCGEPDIEKSCEELVNGVHVVRWPVYAPGDAYHIPRMRSNLKRWLIKSVKYYDVVHFHSVHSMFTMYSLSVLRDFKVHQVLTPHYHGTGHTFFRRILWNVWRRHVRNLLVHVDIVHSVSEYEAQLLAKDFRVNPVIVEHGVEEWILEVDWNPSGYVMYSGRIEKYKNIHRLANIVKHLNNMGLSLELKVFGEGSFKHRLKRHLDNIGIKYEFKPPQPYNEYINYLSRASLFGLLSEKEAFGQTVNEANAIGVPVVVAEPWGRNFAERSRALIVQLDESDEMIAGEIASFLREVGRQARSRVMGWDQVVNTYIEILYP